MVITQYQKAIERHIWRVTDLFGDTRLIPPNDPKGQILRKYKLIFKKRSGHPIIVRLIFLHKNIVLLSFEDFSSRFLSGFGIEAKLEHSKDSDIITQLMATIVCIKFLLFMICGYKPQSWGCDYVINCLN